MHLVLFRTEYLDIIETCRFSASSFGIKNLITDILKAYGKYNTDIISTLMEYVIEAYPEVEKQKNWKNLHKTEYSDINEEIPQFNNPQLQYLYSYLVFLDEYGLVEQIVSDVAEVKPVSLTSFTLQNKEIDFHKLHSILTKDYISSNTKVADLKNIFLGKKISNSKRIVWVCTYPRSKKIFFYPLFELLSQLTEQITDSNDGKLNRREASILFGKIRHSFVKPGNVELTNSQLKSAYYNYRNKADASSQVHDLRSELRKLYKSS